MPNIYNHKRDRTIVNNSNADNISAAAKSYPAVTRSLYSTQVQPVSTLDTRSINAPFQLKNTGIVQLNKKWMDYNHMYFSDDFTARHLSFSSLDARVRSVQRGLKDGLEESTVIVADDSKRWALLNDFSKDYNKEEHGKNDNIVYSKYRFTVVATTYIGDHEYALGTCHEYDTQEYEQVMIIGGVGLNDQYFGQIGHLEGTDGGTPKGVKYRTKVFANSTEWLIPMNGK